MPRLELYNKSSGGIKLEKYEIQVQRGDLKNVILLNWGNSGSDNSVQQLTKEYKVKQNESTLSSI